MAQYHDGFNDAWDDADFDFDADGALNAEGALGLLMDRPVSAWRRIEQWKEERQLRSLLREVYDE